MNEILNRLEIPESERGKLVDSTIKFFARKIEFHDLINDLIAKIDDTDVSDAHVFARDMLIMLSTGCEEEMSKAMADVLEQGNVNQRIGASYVLSAIGHNGNEKVIEQLIAALSDDSHVVRVNVSEILSKIGAVDAVEPMIIALSNYNDLALPAYIVALGDLGDSKAVHPLMELGKRESRYMGLIKEALSKIEAR